MPTRLITGTLRRPDGRAWVQGEVTVSLATLFATTAETVPTETRVFRADTTGEVNIPVVVPITGTAAYVITAPDGTSVTANLDDSGNYDLEDLFAGDYAAPTDIDTTLALILARLAPAYVTLTDAATITWDFAGYPLRNAKVTLGGNRTLDIDNCPNGGGGVLIVTQGTGGGHTLTLPANSYVIEDGAGAITLSSAEGAIDVLTFTHDGTNYYWTYGTNYTDAP